MRLHELLSLGGQWPFTMELVSGVELLEWVRNDEPQVSATTVAGPPGGEAEVAAAARPRPKVDLHRLREAAR